MQLPARLLFPLWLLCLAFSTRAQTISLTVDNQALEKVMASIEQQSGHRFIYSSEMMAISKPVTASFRNETLARALEICFKDQPLTYTLNDKHIVLQVKKPKAAAEEKRVFTGQVVDEKGEGLPGISVLIKGTSKGTTTDAKGQFLLEEVPASFRLEVSGVSIETREIAITNTSFLKIETTQKLGELDQTVVIAYGSAKKRYLVESVSKVKGEDISKQSVSNPILALGGRVAGLQIIQGSGVPGSNVTIRLRGRNSLINGLDPLIVVDGIPFPSTTANTSFSFANISSSVLDNLNPAIIESIEVLKDAAATAIYGSRGANGVILITTKKAQSTKRMVNITAYTGIGFVSRNLKLLNTSQFLQGRLEGFKNDNSVPTNSNAPDLKLWDTSRYTNWAKELIGNRMNISDLNASCGFGNSQTSIMVGSGYRKETTVYAGDFYAQKISALANLIHRSIDNKFSLTLSASFLQNSNKLPKEDLTNYVKTAPNAPNIFTQDGKLNWSNSTWINPYTAVLQYNIGNTQTIQANFSTSYRFWNGFECRLTGGYTSITNNDKYLTPLAALNPASAPIAKSGWNKLDIHTRQIEPQLSYSTAIKSLHNLNFLIGSSFQSAHTSGYFIQGSGYANDNLMGSITNANTVTITNESDIEYRYAAIFGRLNYIYNKRFIFSGTTRRDGSSRYGPRNRFANFWSAALGWIVSEEKWFKRQNIIDFLKFKTSFGSTGNDQIGDYKFLDLYSVYFSQYMGATTYAPTQLYSPTYSWEKVRKSEVGLDLATRNSRLTISVNYYLNRTSNQLINYSLPSTTGFNSILTNIPVVIKNYGWEFEAGMNLLKNSKWSWQINSNLTFPKNKLISFDGLESSTYASSFVIGMPLDVIKVFEYKGVDPATGIYQFTDFNNDGKISAPADQKKVVSTAVSFYGGIENTVSYKKLSISIHAYFSKQPFGKSYLSLFQKPGSIDNQPLYVLDRWQKPGENTNVQRYTATASAPATAYNNFRQSDASFSDASFVRIRNVQVNYGFNWITVFLSGQNLATWAKYKGLDPETGNLLPPIKTITAGLKFSY